MVVKVDDWVGELVRLDLEMEVLKHSKSYLELAGACARPSLGMSIINFTIEERARGYFSANSSRWLMNHDLANELCLNRDEDEPLPANISAVGLYSYSTQYMRLRY